MTVLHGFELGLSIALSSTCQPEDVESTCAGYDRGRCWNPTAYVVELEYCGCCDYHEGGGQCDDSDGAWTPLSWVCEEHALEVRTWPALRRMRSV